MKVFRIKDKKACIFYFLMSIVFLDLGNSIRRLSYVPKIQEFFNESFISITHVYNTGGAFSILQDKTTFLIILSIIILVFIALHVYKEVKYSEKASLIALTLFSAGTLGNLIERIQNGRVIDYFKLNYFNFPVFNAFDIMICAGIFIYTVFVLFELKISFYQNKKDINEKNYNN